MLTAATPTCGRVLGQAVAGLAQAVSVVVTDMGRMLPGGGPEMAAQRPPRGRLSTASRRK